MLKNPYSDFFEKEYSEDWLKEYYKFLLTTPSMITLEIISQDGVIEWIETHLTDQIKRKSIQQFGDNNPYDSVSYLLSNGIAIHIHSLQFVDVLFFDFRHNAEANSIAKAIAAFS